MNGTNMFAYCENNPVDRTDSSGQLWTAVSPNGKVYNDFTMQEKYDIERAGANGWEFYAPGTYKPNPFKNKDGSVSLYNNQRDDHSGTNFNEQWLGYDASPPSFSGGDFSFGSITGYLGKGGWEWKNGSLSPFNYGKASLSGGYSSGVFSLSAMASLWAPSASLKLGGVSITVTGHIGSIGGNIYSDGSGFEVGVAFGAGASIGINW